MNMTTPNGALNSVIMVLNIKTAAREERNANTGTQDYVDSLLKAKNVRTLSAHSSTSKNTGSQGSGRERNHLKETLIGESLLIQH